MHLIDQLMQVNCVQLPFDKIVVEKLNAALKNKIYVSKTDAEGNSKNITSTYNKLEFSKMKTLDKYASNASDQGVEKNIFMIDGCCSDYVDILDGLRIEIYNKLNWSNHNDRHTVKDYESAIVVTAKNITQFYNGDFQTPILTMVKTNLSGLQRVVNLVSPLIEWLLYIGIPISHIAQLDESNNRSGNIILHH